MSFLPAPVPQVRDYMSHFSAAKKNPFNRNYSASLAPYVIYVVAPTATLAPDNVSWIIYSVSSDVPTALLLWLLTTRVEADMYPSRIVLLHSV